MDDVTAPDTSSLLGAINTFGQGLPYGDQVNNMISAFAPQGFNWAPVVQNTVGNQLSQFNGWSTTDDPGQTALKLLSNVGDSWGAPARASLVAAPGFAQSQQWGADTWNKQQQDDGGLFGGDFGKIAMLAALAAGGMGAFGGFGAAGAGSGALDWAAMAAADDAGLGAAFSALGGGAPAATGFQALADIAGGGFAGGVSDLLGGGGGGMEGIWKTILKDIPGIGGGNSSPLSKIFNIGSGVYGITQANELKRMAAKIAEQSDPFASSRGQYISQLNALMADPSGIVNAPGYRAGEQAIMRRMAGQGYLGSGNMMKSLQDFGGNLFDQQIARLAQLSGAGVAPGSGTAAAASTYNSGAAALMSALNRIGYGLGK